MIYRIGRLEFLIFGVVVVLFTGVGLLLGLPGADTNACDTYDVITRLASTFTYHYSRTPGQPFLDYLNFVAWKIGGERAIQAWFILVSALGVTALYRLARENGGSSPLVAACTLALQPLFLAHVGGLGDFAVSSSFLLIALWVGARGFGIAAGLVLAMAVGTRFVFCLYVIPLAILVALSAQRRGESRAVALKLAIQAGAVAGIVSAFFYAPLIAYWGRGLFQNLPWQTVGYHVAGTLYKLFIGLGAAFWVVLAALGIVLIRRRLAGLGLTIRNPGLALSAVVLAGCAALILFRVPTKPELTLPVLIGAILLVQVTASPRWASALLASSVFAGLIVPSPFDADKGIYGWHFSDGWYAVGIQEAYDNRFHLEAVRATLATLPPNSVLVSRATWTDAENERSGVREESDFFGISGLSAVRSIGDLGGNRVIADIQEPKLGELVQRVADSGGGQKGSVWFEKRYVGLLRRWDNLDLTKYGQQKTLEGNVIRTMFRNFGRSGGGASFSARR